MENAKAAPTGCFKCGRPGHWSRDCPSSAPNPNPTSNDFSSSFKANGGASKSVAQKSSEKPKKVPRTRPKLTPELLLSDDGLGYVLRHFPRAFRYRGRGHEVSDLGNLIGLYNEWHSRLLPYYSFDQFVHKVEQVAATKRVKTCIRELRERVSSGGDPTKLHEHPVEPDGLNDEPEVMNSEGLTHDLGDPSLKNLDADGIQEDMLCEIYKKATDGLQSDVAADVRSVGSSRKESPYQVPNNGASCSSEVQIMEEQRDCMEANRLKAIERTSDKSSSEVRITEEQRARMEASRLKAIERTSDKSSSEVQVTEEQRARMEANRLKALERAAARARSLQAE